MKFFIDTAEIEEIKSLADLGLVNGVTTNPSLIYKSGKDFKKVITEISDIVDGPISAEVTSTLGNEMIAQGIELSKISKNVVVKVPLTKEGLMACKELNNRNIKVNVTLCFTTAQALLAGKLGATYISPFIGRLDDISSTGLSLIKDIVKMYDIFKQDIKTEVLAASIRSPLQVSQVALMGAHVATIPPKIIYQMIKHPLTDSGLETFMNDWKKTGQKF
tara:strand:+ start:433 stop:1089 length:657 start_codon:yes stop_codon:yes gene_type:complete